MREEELLKEMRESLRRIASKSFVADAHFIANAPTWILVLEAENDRLVERLKAFEDGAIREIPSSSGIRRKGEIPKLCSVTNCVKDARARGLCTRHYKQLQRHVGGRFTSDD